MKVFTLALRSGSNSPPRCHPKASERVCVDLLIRVLRFSDFLDTLLPNSKDKRVCNPCGFALSVDRGHGSTEQHVAIDRALHCATHRSSQGSLAAG